MSGKSFGADWRPDEPVILEVAGVVYSFDAVDGWQAYSYKATYLPAALEMSRRVYASNREDFLALLTHWNQDEKWRYDE